jgi:hypothetical protein
MLRTLLRRIPLGALVLLVSAALKLASTGGDWP